MVDGGEDSILSCMFVFPIEGEILSNDRDRERYKRCDLHTSYIAKKKWNFFLQMMVSSPRMAVDGDIKSKLSTPTWTSKHLLLSDVTIKHLRALLKRHYNAASWPFARKIVDYWESLLFFSKIILFSRLKQNRKVMWLKTRLRFRDSHHVYVVKNTASHSNEKIMVRSFVCWPREKSRAFCLFIRKQLYIKKELSWQITGAQQLNTIKKHKYSSSHLEVSHRFV